jgi:hypothetical protein
MPNVVEVTGDRLCYTGSQEPATLGVVVTRSESRFEITRTLPGSRPVYYRIVKPRV